MTEEPGFSSNRASPAGIRNAASVIVTRPSASGAPEIYMVRRSAKSTFMPSTLVFPGGALDAEDGDPDRAETWTRAARRECEEEANLRLETELVWFDTWLTPSAEPRRRYLARFFWASVPAGVEARADGVETHEGRWGRAEEHLEAWDREEVDLPPPTLSILLRFAELGTELEALRAVDPEEIVLPKFTLEDGKPLVVMPHDPQYPSVPGEARPAPARVHGFPPRFARTGRVWRPCSTPES